ncbi:head protein [Erwinia typographi]|uniref:Head protein n=1 Tax=Erwinia typographi TaxID=371042 RepID=A0A0A3Z8V7_9GAMM|nr:Mu-like prophage major head subunit gpT family protein [Erwinia typographi]KGT95305.1 head protein [Erwinia typographi]
MAEITKANLDVLFLALKKSFSDALSRAQPNWGEVATLIPSTTAANYYAWMEQFPQLRKWVGDKMVQRLQRQDYVVPNDDYEATISVKRNHIEDDQLGIYPVSATAYGTAAANWPDKLIYDLVNNGFSAKCFDGQPFFSAKHPVAKKTFSNLLSAPLSIASLAEAQASFGKAREMMWSLQDSQGEPLSLNPNILLVGPALFELATSLVTTDRLEDGKPNPYKGAAKVVMSQRIKSATAWFLLDTTQALKPFIFQQRRKPTFVSQLTPDSDSVFMRAEYLFGAEARGAAAYAFWQMAVGSTGDGK